MIWSWSTARAERLADPHVVERGGGGVEDVDARGVAEGLVAVDPVELADLHARALAQGLQHVDVAGGQAGDAGVLVGDRPEDDLVQLGQALLPVVGVLLHDETVVALPRVEHERAGAHRLRAGVVPRGGGRGGREGPPDGEAELVGPRRVGVRELVGDGEVVDHHYLDVREGSGGVGALGLEVVPSRQSLAIR